MIATPERPIIKDEADQQMIDTESATLLCMEPWLAALIRSTAWQIAKDDGMDDWRQALPAARRYIEEQV